MDKSETSMRVEPLRGTVEAELGAHRMKRHKGKETRSMSQGERWKGEQGGGQWLRAESIDQHGNAIRRKNDSVHKTSHQRELQSAANEASLQTPREDGSASIVTQEAEEVQ